MGQVYDRVMPRIKDGLFIEHGQRCDAANHDGTQYGWDKVKDALNPSGFTWLLDKTVGLKKFDPIRRETFVTGAAAHWAMNNSAYGLYVMGHTHKPDLKYVEVSIKEWTEEEIRAMQRKAIAEATRGLKL